MVTELLGCKHCNLYHDECPVLNKPKCPINELWRIADELGKATVEAVAEAERILMERKLAE